MTGVLARLAIRRDMVRQRRILAVMLLRDLLDVGPASGYPLIRATGEGIAATYLTLTQMERDGHVVADWEEPTRAGRAPRRFYRLTDAGRVYAGVVVARWLRGDEGR